MSAGSKTNPGGYGEDDSLEQFEISDERSVSEVSSYLKSSGYDVVWKDWDISYDNQYSSSLKKKNSVNRKQSLVSEVIKH